MALRTGLGYFHIDPLKIDFTTVTDIMSSDYARVSAFCRCR